jgi:hypothetical protein
MRRPIIAVAVAVLILAAATAAGLGLAACGSSVDAETTQETVMDTGGQQGSMPDPSQTGSTPAS